MLERQFARYLDGLKRQYKIPLSLELWNGSRVDLAETPTVHLKLKSVTAARLLMKPTMANLGEAYIEGEIELGGAIEEIVRIADQLASTTGEPQPQGGAPNWLARHTRRTDRKAIEYHYDVSNAFYQCWLDP